MEKEYLTILEILNNKIDCAVYDVMPCNFTTGSSLNYSEGYLEGLRDALNIIKEHTADCDTVNNYMIKNHGTNYKSHGYDYTSVCKAFSKGVVMSKGGFKK